MSEHDWEEFRTLVKEVLRDPPTVEAITLRAEISLRTLTRWASGETKEPDRKHLYRLLQVVPSYRDRLTSAIVKAFPDFDVPLIDNTKDILEELPLDFFIRLHEANARIPKNLRFASLVNMIFTQLQPYIDPQRIGVQLAVAQCSVPSSPEHVVRSLREVVKMKTSRSLHESPSDNLFLGAESLPGYSVSTSKPHVVQNIQEERVVPVRKTADEQSAAAYPIQRGGYVAGCFLVSSPELNFFSPRLQYILQIYVYFLALAFDQDMFYDPEQIRLRPMPEESIQHRSITGFQDRVMNILQYDIVASRLQAETQAWQQIEADLLSLVPSVQ